MDLIAVSVACPCPGKPHEEGGDTVYLAPYLGYRAGMLAEATMVRVWTNLDTSSKVPMQTEKSLSIEASLREIYILDGVKDWTFEGEDGPVPVTEDTIHEWLLSNFTLARPVGDQADTLYTASVLDPLLGRLSKSSPTTRTKGSTSANGQSSSKRPKPLKPSLITTSDKARQSA
jgi:hypothetical protein